jgi:hypothetical protein
MANRKRFEGIGISDDDADLLLQDKWFSPVHRTAITDALVSLGSGHGQEVFLNVLTRAASEVDANYFQQVAELMEQYNRSISPAQKIIRTGRTIAFTDGKGNWVFPVSFDYCLWTKDVHERAQRGLEDRDPRRPVVLYTTGNFSDLAAAECARDHITVRKTSLTGN